MAADQSFLITGVANSASIAWAVTRLLVAEGSDCLLAIHPANRRRVEKLLDREGLHADCVDLDARDDGSFRAMGERLTQKGTKLAGVLHAIAYANMDDLLGRTVDASRQGFLEAIEVSAYSFLALVRTTEPFLDENSGVVALTYFGSQYCIPGYNIMGVAKAALESSARYAAGELGGRGIRVNTVSPGPLLTLSSSVFPDIERSLAQSARQGALKSELSVDAVAKTICHLLGPSAAAVTGQCIRVDNGLSSIWRL